MFSKYVFLFSFKFVNLIACIVYKIIYCLYINIIQGNGTAATSRRKRRVPVKRTPSGKQGVRSRERTSTRCRSRVTRKERSVSQERIPLKERLLQVKARLERKEKELTPAVESEKEEEDEEEEKYEMEEAEEEDGDKKRRRKKDVAEPKPPRPKAVLEGYPWQCTDCPVVLASLQELRNHHQTLHHQPPNFKCVQCAKVYTRYRSFARHVKLHRNPKKFRYKTFWHILSYTQQDSNAALKNDEFNFSNNVILFLKPWMF